MRHRNVWRLDEILRVVRADGLLPLKEILKLLPKRTIVSIEDFSKRFSSKFPGAFNGLPYSLVKIFDPDCPRLWTETVNGEICLWADLANRRARFPEEVRSSFEMMADLQVWFHDATTETVRGKICKVLTSCQPDRPKTKTIPTSASTSI